jgi:hypothetical protein
LKDRKDFTLKALIDSAPVRAESTAKAPNGLPYCMDLKAFKEKCALSGEQIQHIVKGRTIRGPHVGYSITTFIFSDDGGLTTNDNTGGSWKVDSNLLSITNHWHNGQPRRFVMSQEQANLFGLHDRNGRWFSWE